MRISLYPLHPLYRQNQNQAPELMILRRLFLIEGLITLAVAVWSFYIMPASLTQTKSKKRCRPKSWFTPHEEKVLVTRLLRDDPSKSTMHNRETVSPRLFWEAITDYNIWPLYLLVMVSRVPGFTPDLYFTLILRELGFSTGQTNLLSIVPAIGCIPMVCGVPDCSRVQPQSS